MTFSVMDTGEKGLRHLHEEENVTKERMAINRAIRDLLVRSRTSKAGVHNTLDTTVNALNIRLQDLQYQLQLTQESPDAGKSQSVAALNAEINRVSAQIARLNELQGRRFAPRSDSLLREAKTGRGPGARVSNGRRKAAGNS